jgi:hypothetical protein
VLFRQLLVAVLTCGHILSPLQQRLVGEDKQNTNSTDKQSTTPLFVFYKKRQDKKQKNPRQRKKENL